MDDPKAVNALPGKSQSDQALSGVFSNSPHGTKSFVNNDLLRSTQNALEVVSKRGV
jgi:hypothetical protein